MFQNLCDRNVKAHLNVKTPSNILGRWEIITAKLSLAKPSWLITNYYFFWFFYDVGPTKEL